MAGALILNSGYEPIKVVDWKKAILLWFQDKVEVLEYHTQTVRSASESFRLPSVIQLKRYVRPSFTRQVRLSRQNIFLRDECRCQYCHKVFPMKQLTIDHVTPLSKGGKHIWTNVASACSKCNNRKGDKTLEQINMKLFKKPVRPRWLPQKELSLSNNHVPIEWQMYLNL